MSETFEKLMKNRDYWRDEAKAGLAKIEALEAENEELRWAKNEAMETERKELRKEIKKLQQLEKWQLLMINHTTKERIREMEERKTKEARDRVAKEVSQLNLDLAAWSKRQEDDQEAEDLA